MMHFWTSVLHPQSSTESDEYGLKDAFSSKGSRVGLELPPATNPEKVGFGMNSLRLGGCHDSSKSYTS